MQTVKASNAKTDGVSEKRTYSLRAFSLFKVYPLEAVSFPFFTFDNSKKSKRGIGGYTASSIAIALLFLCYQALCIFFYSYCL